MRITTNMLVQQLIQATKSDGIQKPETGAAITAKVLEVMNGSLVLDIGNGKQITARDLSGQSFIPGQTVTFDVLGTDENGALQIRPATTAPDASHDQQAPELLLKKLNLPDNASNRDLLRALTAYRIPLTPENIKTAQEISLNAKNIIRMVDQTGTAVLAEHAAEPLKQTVLKLLDMVRSAGVQPTADTALSAKNLAVKLAELPTEAVPATEPAVTKASSSEAQKPVLPPMTTTGAPALKTEAQQQPADKMLDTAKAGSPVKSDNLLLPAITETETDEAITHPVKPDVLLSKESLRGNELKEVLRQLTFDKIGFVIKNQLPGDMETLATLDKLIMGKKELAVQLKDLLNIIGSDQSAAPLRDLVQKAIHAVHLKQELNPFELQTQLKSLNQTLTTLSAQASESSTNPAVKESLAEVKNSLDFLGRLSESATYLHVPVNLGQGTKPMDLYVQRDKSGKKKVNPQDTRIFISLDTNHLDTVQCLVDIQDKRLNIGFKLADTDIMTLFGKYFAPLKEALVQLGYTDVSIHGTVFQKPLNLMDISQEAPQDQRRIDMRV